jgi:hypothetical protein
MNRRPDQRILSPRRGLRSRNRKVDQRSPRRGLRSRNRKLDQRSPSQGPKRNLDPKRGLPNLSRDPRRNLHLILNQLRTRRLRPIQRPSHRLRHAMRRSLISSSEGERF